MKAVVKLLRSAWQNDYTTHSNQQHTQAKYACTSTINDTFELSDLHEACWSIIVEYCYTCSKPKDECMSGCADVVGYGAQSVPARMNALAGEDEWEARTMMPGTTPL